MRFKFFPSSWLVIHSSIFFPNLIDFIFALYLEYRYRHRVKGIIKIPTDQNDRSSKFYLVNKKKKKLENKNQEEISREESGNIYINSCVELWLLTV